MTNRTILETILTEASGRPRSEVRELMNSLPHRILKKLEASPPIGEARRMLEGMRRELPAIRQWAITGLADLRDQMNAYGVTNLPDLWAARGMFEPSPSSPSG
jgi:hypothetical protein